MDKREFQNLVSKLNKDEIIEVSYKSDISKVRITELLYFRSHRRFNWLDCYREPADESNTMPHDYVAIPRERISKVQKLEVEVLR